MSMTNDDMIKEICEHLNLMLSFAEKAGIVIDEMLNYSVKRDELSFSTTKNGVKEENDEYYENICISLDKAIDRVRVTKETSYSYNFVLSEETPDCQDYLTTCYQEITEFLVRDGKLEVTTASITQTIYENTIFSGTESVVHFESIADFKKLEKQNKLPANHSEILMNTKSYSIPEGYRITDGVGPMENSPKVMEKATQP